jgi:LacI family transcriptional regulator
MKSHGLEPLPYFCLEPDEFDASLLKMLERQKAPTAIFTTHGPSTKALLTSLRRFEMRMPGDLALVGFDDFDMAALIGLGISVVSQPVRQLARACSELLFRRLLGESVRDKPVRIVLPAELIVRGSSGPRRTSALDRTLWVLPLAKRNCFYTTVAVCVRVGIQEPRKEILK